MHALVLISAGINIVVGLTETSLIGSEDVGTIEICAAFISGDCTFDVFFEVHFRTEYDSAGTISDDQLLR